MKKNELIKFLQSQIRKPQQSERWVMYKIINPIVDYACELTSWYPYYEFPQAKLTPASQKIDIGIFDNLEPRAFVEAKKIRKKIDPDLILPYLKGNVIGLVSNGYNWIITVKNGSSHNYSYITIFNNGLVNEKKLDLIISSLTVSNPRDILKEKQYDWVTDVVEIGNNLKTFIPPYQKATKIYHEYQSFKDPTEGIKFIKSFENISNIQYSFCTHLLNGIKVNKENLHFEIRKSRMSWFFEPSKRIGRIEFTGKKANILVKSEIVLSNPKLDTIVKSKVHSKHRGMRVFDIFDEDTTVIFGKELGKIIKNL